jgi:hypothetical protein
MKDVIGRFLTFQETLGAGLVKFAYYVLLTLFVIATLVAMIGGIILMFDDLGAGLWQLVAAPFQLVIAAILLRIATELVLAVLSIDDQLTDGARTEGAMPKPRRSSDGKGSSAFATKTPLPHGDTEASRDDNQKAPFTQTSGDKEPVPGGPSRSMDDKAPATKTPLPHGDSEASRPENQKAPFTSGGDKPAVPGGPDKKQGSDATKDEGYEAKKVDTAAADTKPKDGDGPASSSSSKSTAAKRTKSSAAKTAAAARKSPASARSDEAKKDD